MAFIAAGSCEPLRVWSRLEPRARQVDFAEALSARIADPMFMLARQWQFGEFAGEDGGSAVLATIARRVTPVSAADTDDPDAGLEPVAERLPLDFPIAVRARLGRIVLSCLDTAAAGAGPVNPPYDSARYRDLLRVELGIDDDDPADVLGQARDRAAPRLHRVRAALRGRAVDGLRVLRAVGQAKSAAELPAALAAGIAPEHLSLVLTGLREYLRWFTDTYGEAAANTGWWRPDQLEYGGAVTAARDDGTLRLTLDEHVGGRLDWYSFGQSVRTPGTASQTTGDIRTVIPTPADFPGMPKPRWWQMEDAAVDLGKLRADTTDAARIVVTEFALLFGNNWFVVPCSQPVGSVAEVEGVVVTDVFGWRTLVPAAPRPSGAWSDWDLFSLARRASSAPVTPLPQHLFIPATLTHYAQGQPHESVALVRDETADMVWAVEQRVPDGLGASQDGNDATRRLRQELLPVASDTQDGSVQSLRYVAQSEVAENWIPFLPVHVPGDLRAIRLQRGALQRTALPQGDRVRPVTSILRQGIAPDDSTASPYYLDEQEVPRAGVFVHTLMRRGRRFDGVPVVWNAHTVVTGRGSGNSGLTFDQVVEPRA